MFLEQALRNHLVANAQLAGQVGNRIFWAKLDQSTVLPAVTVQRISGIPEYTHDGNDGLVESRVQLSCFAADYVTAKNLAANVKRAMRPLEQAPAVRGGAGGVHIAGAFLENELDIYEPNDVEHVSQFLIPLDYLIQSEEDF